MHRFGTLTLLLFSAAALVAAPFAMPDSYSWVAHTTSESAAQGLEGAWLARLGFLLLGLGVLWLASTHYDWSGWATAFFAVFGAMMLAAAAFSHRPWLPSVEFDPFEDVLHSVAATAMGFAFAAGVVAVTLHRRQNSVCERVGDVVAVASSVVLPLGMMALTDLAGLLQRTMFGIAYLWFAHETLRFRDDAKTSG